MTCEHSPDPHAWLEDITGEAQLDWVRSCNDAATARLETGRFGELKAAALSVLNSQDKIPGVVQRGDYLYNFWTDASHERGIWRRTTWDSYRTDEPEWETLIDVDELGRQEGVNWVWHGASVLYPSHDRALVALSRGGSDADTTREFDLSTRRFVEGGFIRPEAKGAATWGDTRGEEVLIFTDFGEGSLTRAGYPRIVKRWRRGTPISDAEVLYEGSPEDNYIGAGFDATPGFERTFVQRGIEFYNSQTFELRGSELVLIDVPTSADAGGWREWLLVLLREEWTVDGVAHPGGTLLAFDYEDFLAGGRAATVLFTPTESTSLSELTSTRHHVVLTLLEDVKNRLVVLTPPAPTATDRTWRRVPLDLSSAQGEVPEFGTIAVGPVDDKQSDQLWLTTEGFVTPSTLSLLTLDPEGETVGVERLKALPHFFDATGMEVTQHFATSADGTRVPYFQVSPGGKQPVPTLLYGYGGFEVPLLPSYAPVAALSWIARGGVYVLANIRGGGEYGPRWHRAALREKRHKAYEDFAAVADDLVARGVTLPSLLGTQGGSNGGLLMGNMLTQYPQKFGAIVCQVPLLDMRRYSHLLAGASWMAEYGDPDDPEQWEFLRTFSPYHLFDPDRHYPPILLTTSTRDDRVHPGHARKMAALLQGADKDVTYWENIEGGHGGAATNAQRAHMQALAYEFLWQRLGGPAQ